MVKDRTARMLAATVAPRMSPGGYVASRVVAFMNERGCDHIPEGIKSDNEPAAVDLVERELITAEISVAHSSASQGIVEKGVLGFPGLQGGGLLVRAHCTVAGEEASLCEDHREVRSAAGRRGRSKCECHAQRHEGRRT